MKCLVKELICEPVVVPGYCSSKAETFDKTKMRTETYMRLIFYLIVNRQSNKDDIGFENLEAQVNTEGKQFPVYISSLAQRCVSCMM